MPFAPPFLSHHCDCYCYTQVDAHTMVVMDTFALPVEGTETRVNPQAQAYEFMTTYSEHCDQVKMTWSSVLDVCNNSFFKVGRFEKCIGWYHSHPGYGCWLSGIDVSTQMLNQQFQEPFVAVVVRIDPQKYILILCYFSLFADRSYSHYFCR